MGVNTSNYNKIVLAVVVTAVIAILLLVGGVALYRSAQEAENTQPNQTSQIDDTEEHDEVDHEDENHDEEVVALDYTKLPLGDNKTSTSPKVGYVYSCQTSFNGGGAFTQGPWIDTENNTWDLTKKISVDGAVTWQQAYWQAVLSGTNRVIKSADLPLGHTTGIFPISSSDEAYSYDRNPNSIAEQTISFQIPKTPTLLSSPECVGGEVGIATTGVLIFSAFDAAGRDAVATEIQDSCEGHPQAGSYYHYHGYSSCFEDNQNESEHSDLLGYAFDGFGLYGLKGEDGRELSTQDLDECHGHTHTINWDGEEVEMYHYHMTQDFPYTIGCFRGQTSVKSLSSGEGAANAQPAGGPPTGTKLPPRR